MIRRRSGTVCPTCLYWRGYVHVPLCCLFQLLQWYVTIHVSWDSRYYICVNFINCASLYTNIELGVIHISKWIIELKPKGVAVYHTGIQSKGILRVPIFHTLTLNNENINLMKSDTNLILKDTPNFKIIYYYFTKVLLQHLSRFPVTPIVSMSPTIVYGLRCGSNILSVMIHFVSPAIINIALQIYWESKFGRLTHFMYHN